MVRLFVIFLVLSLISTLGMAFFGVRFGNENYWHMHGVFLLFFLAFFPRLALLFSSIPFGGLLWWVGFFFCPRYLIALLATFTYWAHNPVLVSIAWFVALGGESTEKYYIHRRMRREAGTTVIDVETRVIDKSPS